MHVALVGGLVVIAADTLIPGGIACAMSLACADNSVGSLQRVFWSGGDVAKSAATGWAQSNNAVTIEMTPIGQNLEEITKSMDWLTEARPLWEAAAEDFAAGASGEVHVFLNSGGYSPSGIWQTIEYPTLILNNNVTGIIFVSVP